MFPLFNFLFKKINKGNNSKIGIFKKKSGTNTNQLSKDDIEYAAIRQSWREAPHTETQCESRREKEVWTNTWKLV